jgi:hypothetical protein
VETEYAAEYCRRHRTLYGAGTDGILGHKKSPGGITFREFFRAVN